MLKAHQACIDLEKNVLRIQGREVSFLSEHELPERTRVEDLFESRSPSAQETPVPSGSGQTLGSSTAGLSSQPHISRSPSDSQHPESAIRTLMDLGASREQAIGSLDAAGGNVDVAAALLF
ncbi:hypothetical protein F5148DRAFT_296376 [Russula earlei]|uniref:Uncharacterized protein n=1 Tax=Russula earlei TaxID=71964 RepID=A0ACC0UP41_9AGAM|nr:hypothetical protein F5148DRAFT_296376 [Russula earlei]